MNINAEYEITRADGEVDAVVKGWTNTHVLFDAWDVEKREWRSNLSRPIVPFMVDYGLFN